VKLHNMFKKTVGKEHGTSKNTKVRNVPEGLLKKCNKCGAAILAEDAVNNNYICPKCHGYFRMHAGRRIEMIADPGTFEEWDAKMKFENPLEFSGYEEKVRRLREQTGLDEAVVTGKVMIAGHPAVIGVCDGRFMMASMGEVHKSDRTGYERKSSGYFVRMFWRRKDAGRDRFSYADGENGGCAETAQ
jgi:acetyl-CoA carboxylase beta subunit